MPGQAVFGAALGDVLVAFFSGQAQARSARSLWCLETTNMLDSALDRFSREQLSWVSVNTCTLSDLVTSEEKFLLIGLYKEN